MNHSDSLYNFTDWLSPETALENALLQDSYFREGLLWGEPRFGHPEGLILLHIHEVLNNIEKLSVTPLVRQKLRLVAYVHDTFKHKEDKNRLPRNWQLHHGVLARKFMEQFTHDREILDLIELHDEAYYSWRMISVFNKKTEGFIRLHRLLNRIQPFLQLYYLFFKCDTCTGDKNPAPMKWFETNVPGIQKISLCKY